ncbi:ABC transporter permease [Chitinophagaceae bacterium LB-8]|uniref:ABC transporter permease n=1 Tax=Paraflavisolibacter caeni TaxID=2982496 RepID=A0A9X2XTL1_9BACT|nr:ABC transporter permease [Paraflavisolibacter caeni]MCU7549004.1 ABC transporter permease [Paraflavisolibacter caeni]
MFRNYLTIAVRNLLKNKVFSAVNILGLAIGMAACFFVFLYVNFESSYDRFHKNAANLYRVTISYSGSFSNLPPMASNHPAVGPAMKNNFPEVIDFTRAVNTSLFGGVVVSYTNNKANPVTFNEDKILIVDDSFLRLFSFPLITGNHKTALSDGNTVVISQNTAAKYFGNENPIGKTLFINQQLPLKVTGIIKEVPENSHIKFNMLVSFKTLGENFGYDNWTWPEYYNYVLLKPGVDIRKLETKLPAFVNKYLGPTMAQLNFGCQLHLQKVTDIHLKSHLMKEAESNGSEKDIYFLSIIGVLILLVGWINYVNLSTAKSMERVKEVGLRKVIGASQAQLITQFISESFILNLMAIFIAALIVLCCFPFFSNFIGKNISQEFISSGLLQQPKFWAIVVALFITGAFLVGAYPAFVLVRYKPALVLKGKFSQSVKGIFLRKALVTLQFILSVLLIAGTIVVYKQLSFMRSQQLGYNKDQIVVVKAPVSSDSSFGSRIVALKNELLKNPSVTGVSGSSEIPGKLIIGRNSIRKASVDKTHNFITFIQETDENFLDTYEMNLIAGRKFLPTDTASFFAPTQYPKIMVNEEVVRALGFESNEAAIHQPVIFSYGNGENKGEIVGVVKNYHQRSLKEVYDPIIYLRPSGNNWNYISIRVETKNLSQNIASIEAVYKGIFTANVFEYFFLDDFFNMQYQGDQRFGKVFSLFTILAIFVACLGLLGLSSFVSRLRIKEIGIRKVLGASVYSILVLLSKDFVKLVLIASVIAIPIFYFVSNIWLQNYAFHIKLNWVMFVLPPLLLLFIALITSSIQSVSAALANPVASIHTE